MRYNNNNDDLYDLLFGKKNTLEAPTDWALLQSAGFVISHQQGDYVQLHTKERMTQEYGTSWAIGLKIARVITTPSSYNNMDGGTKDEPLDNHPLLAELATVEGLIQAAVVPYAIGLTKGTAFQWEELMPRILDAWQTYKMKQEFYKQ